MTNHKPISEIDTLAQLAEQVQGLRAISKLRPILRRMGKSGRNAAQALDQLPAFEQEFEELRRLPERFNAMFSPRGWIAYELLDAELVRQAVRLGEAGKLDEAEQLLVDFYNEPVIRRHLLWFRTVKAFRPHERLLQLALTDYLAGRYHACIPVVLSQADGIVKELSGGSLFTDYSKRSPNRLVAWDSISAHPDGLPVVVTSFSQGRETTTEKSVVIPYRHGVQHGRDLGYDTKLGAAKAWALLFALREWALKVEQGKKHAPPPTPKPTMGQVLKQAWATSMATARQRRAMERWQPRAIDPGNLPATVEQLETGSPERVAAEWVQAWQTKDFVRMAELTTASTRRRYADMPKRLDDLFGFKDVRDFRVVAVEDTAPAMTQVRLWLRYEVGARTFEKVLHVNVIHEDTTGGACARGTDGGRWGVQEISALRETDWE